MVMASSDQNPTPAATAEAAGVGGSTPPGAQLLQPLKPVHQVKQHVCTFALYDHDLSRQMETHHYAARLNQDFLQCAVYDSDQPNARLIEVSSAKLGLELTG